MIAGTIPPLVGATCIEHTVLLLNNPDDVHRNSIISISESLQLDNFNSQISIPVLALANSDSMGADEVVRRRLACDAGTRKGVLET